MRRKLIYWLLAGQIFGVVAAAIAAAIDVESIIFTGPLLSAVGLLLAGSACRRNRVTALYFALGVPTISVICFVLIYGFRWDPRDAQLPISLLLVVFAIGYTLAVPAVIHDLRRDAPASRKFRMRFTIKDLLALTLLVAINAGLMQTGSEPLVALGLLATYAACLAYFLRQLNASSCPAISGQGERNPVLVRRTGFASRGS